MSISNRIKTIADMIDDSDENIYDLGCDHALLDVYLAQKYNSINCVASDINENALKNANKNIKNNLLENRISTIISDGLDNIDVKKDCAIVISGMGTLTIKHILQNKKAYLAKKIIIQSNNDLYELRKFMISKGFIISDEYVVLERKKYYVIICFKRGYKKYKKIDLFIGPKILENNKINKDYLNYIKNKEQLILNKLPKKNIMLRIRTKLILNKLKKYI